MYDKRHYYRKMPTYMDISRQGGIDVCMREKKKRVRPSTLFGREIKG